SVVFVFYLLFLGFWVGGLVWCFRVGCVYTSVFLFFFVVLLSLKKQPPPPPQTKKHHPKQTQKPPGGACVMVGV
ncbi:hypothetical protein ACNIV5_25930, partial [Escherichia coli]